MRPNVPSPGAFWRLVRLLITLRPDVVHTWLYHADLVGGLAARLTGIAPVVWGIHHSTGRSEPLKPSTRGVVRVNRVLSFLVPNRIVCCAHAARASHVTLGYSRKRMLVIANGFDTDTFHPDPAARADVRRELGLAADTPIVGISARFHPQKDHQTFVRAAGYLADRLPAVRFLLAGHGVDRSNEALLRWIDATGSPNRFHLLGKRDDMPRLTAACDVISVSSAYGEGLPLVLGEAMSCGVPCVSTNVGDSALIVGRTGRIVPPGNPEALANAWASLLTLTRDERLQLGEQARERVLAEYSLGTATQKHLALYQTLSRPRGG
jgi:glycosyltransferase involved in cell wall biosynthesis